MKAGLHLRSTAARPVVLVLLAFSLGSLSRPGLGAAQFSDQLAISASPNPASTREPVIVRIAGLAICPEASAPLYPAEGVVEFHFSGHCPILSDPTLFEFVLYKALPPLTAGLWEIRLIDTDSAATTSDTLVVLDPDFSVELFPSPSTVNDVVTAVMTLFASNSGVRDFDIEPGKIVIRVDECGLCDPPPPRHVFQLEQSLGRLDEGDYLVELYFNDLRVAETTHTVVAGERCIPGPTTLCLAKGRFRVEVTWNALGPKSGLGRAIEETDDTGLFWFFNPGNLELMVKVLDACDTAFESFWVFAGGLTNVGVVLEVTDVETQESVVYESPLGQTFVPITDTSAFFTCTP